MRRLAAAVLLLSITLPHPAEAWGFDGHRFVMERAIAVLPPEIRDFFVAFRTQVVEHSIDPDLWRTAGWEQEFPRHFVDMDAYGPYPFRQMPHGFDEAVARYGREFVENNGTLPWRTEEIYRKLVDAFTQKSPYARENIKFFSSVAGHYIADAHVPFHAALNHDGQLTGQWGLHARFESELFERYKDRLKVAPGPVRTIANPREFAFTALTESFQLVQPILDADKAAAAGRDVYDDQYFSMLFEKVRPILEKRLSDSIEAVASMIASAWIEAGRPALAVEQARTPRKVRRQ